METQTPYGHGSEKHHRRSVGLRGYDYRQPGAYPLTNPHVRSRCLFGEVIGGEMRKNRGSRIVAEGWDRMADVRPDEMSEVFVVMPNHVHGIIHRVDDAGPPSVDRAAGTGVSRGVGAAPLCNGGIGNPSSEMNARRDVSAVTLS